MPPPFHHAPPPESDHVHMYVRPDVLTYVLYVMHWMWTVNMCSTYVSREQGRGRDGERGRDRDPPLILHDVVVLCPCKQSLEVPSTIHLHKGFPFTLS
ncbi:hypothetical protein IE53DRAFT_215568 [Violaceomyces palustris]|uniref:Uncharacterized protein n=1 Tax=Violaceomyces palustris TaxID=1673888 RepID=A0ACD0NQF6_9BASI|nr:hypothetical protein IE53DRAFT_215568 [Violaceomyces palustris]